MTPATDDLDDAPVLSQEPIFYPDRTCPHCQGSGHERVERRLTKCRCVLFQQLNHYLGPTYAPLPFLSDFDARPYHGKDVVIRKPPGQSLHHFRPAAYTVVKAFLITTDQHLTHRTLTPCEIFSTLFKESEGGALELSSKVDLLVVPLCGDPPKKYYQSQLPWLLQKRQDNGLSSWVLLGLDPASPRFDENYPGLRGPLQELLDAGFIELQLR